MRCDRLGDAGSATRLLAGDFYCGPRDRLPWQIAGKQPLLRPSLPIVVAENAQEFGREHDVAVLAPLAFLDANDHALAVDRGRLQADGFGDSQTGRVTDG